ncbi:hypothetical protein KRX51_06105 [Corynebacterium sp. TAE3-ERU12]|uniref:hypothetical protein n=1 Tax=Corynebacterium sp. TAE3-ERU12 TaxID=2849491 RepID=UPI001C47A5D8|nr:hypothetical protein [Corynebacterium sp. TAE3-ERU12]MBV7295492.1 hypothetical protein [Corynebacterium sp. TAE3-ERU12]
MNVATLERMLRMRYVRATLLIIFIAVMVLEKAWIFVLIGLAFLALAVYQIKQLREELPVMQEKERNEQSTPGVAEED